MKSPISVKILSRGLLLISAAIFANTSLAADHVGDAQMHAGDLLSGTVGAPKSTDKSLASLADHRNSYPDSQEQARQLILGEPNVDGAVSREFSVQSQTNVPVPLSARRNTRVHSDPQEQARRMILGTEGSGRESTGMRLSGIQEVKN